MRSNARITISPQIAIYEISKLLNTGLDRETLTILISLCECGVNPEVRPAAPNQPTQPTPPREGLKFPTDCTSLSPLPYFSGPGGCGEGAGADQGEPRAVRRE